MRDQYCLDGVSWVSLTSYARQQMVVYQIFLVRAFATFDSDSCYFCGIHLSNCALAFFSRLLGTHLEPNFKTKDLITSSIFLGEFRSTILWPCLDPGFSLLEVGRPRGDLRIGELKSRSTALRSALESDLALRDLCDFSGDSGRICECA